MPEAPRRICYVTPTGRIGGGEVSLLHLVRRLDRSRWQPVVVSFTDGDLVDALREQGIQVAVIQRAGRLSEPALVLRLARFLRRSRIGLVHVNTLDIRAGLAARLARCRLVGHLRVIYPTTVVDRLFVHLSHRAVAVSEAARRAFSAGRSTLYHRFTVVANGVDVEGPPPGRNGLRLELGLPMDAPIVGAVGRLDPVKGLENLVAAAPGILRHFPETRFVVAGRAGPLEEEQRYARDLEAQVERLGLTDRFHFIGHRADPLAVIGGLDVLTVPSVVLGTGRARRAEGFGRVAAEAMAVRTPVVASAAGGLPEVLGGSRAGILVPPADPAALADAVIRILHDGHLRERLVRAALERFRARFTIERHVASLEDLYASMC